MTGSALGYVDAVDIKNTTCGSFECAVVGHGSFLKVKDVTVERGIDGTVVDQVTVNFTDAVDGVAGRLCQHGTVCDGQCGVGVVVVEKNASVACDSSGCKDADGCVAAEGIYLNQAVVDQRSTGDVEVGGGLDGDLSSRGDVSVVEGGVGGIDYAGSG